MPTYVLLEGFHYTTRSVTDSQGRVRNELVKHTKGDEIDSDDDLCTKFVNKFRLKDDGMQAKEITAERRAAVERLIQSGSWPESDRQFLFTVSDDGFGRITRRDQTRDEASPPSEGEPVKAKSRLGDDVTDQFQEAYDNGLLVFLNGNGKYQVARTDKPTKCLNKEALGSPAAVEVFLKDFLEDAAKK